MQKGHDTTATGMSCCFGISCLLEVEVNPSDGRICSRDAATLVASLQRRQKGDMQVKATPPIVPTVRIDRRDM